MNNKNLIKNSERTPSEHRAAARKGGIKSGVARRAKKTMRELAFAIGRTIVRDTGPDGIEQEVDLTTLVVMRLYQRAIQGDVRAIRTLMELRGELKQVIEDKWPRDNIIIVHSEEEKRMLEDLGKLDV